MPGGKLKLGGKHKRRERGSVEEEQTCKRSNMASEESEPLTRKQLLLKLKSPRGWNQGNVSRYKD